MTYDSVLREGIQRGPTKRCTENFGGEGISSNTLVLKSPPPTIDLSLASNKTVTSVKHVRKPSRSSLSSKPLTKRAVSTLSPTTLSSTGHKVTVKDHKQNIFEIPRSQVIISHLIFALTHMFGMLREVLRKIGLEKKKGALDNNPADFVPLYSGYEPFYVRNSFVRGRDILYRPVCSVPGAEIEIKERKTDDHNWTYYYSGRVIKALNMGSYNYLGFAENNGPSSSAAMQSIHEYGVATCASSQELGMLKCQVELESLMARFLGVEAAIVFGMGFATNSMNIPALMCDVKRSLIISDELNHASLILGSRLSVANIKTFKHNDMQDLEAKLRKAVIEGHSVSGRPYEKILIIVEGIYSMEGTMCPLKEIIALKKKYKAYLYLDEAHSIGALGPNGRGIADHYGCDPRDVDILMGTFSKSFGAAGGYIAGSQKLVNFMKHNSHAHCYATSISPPVCLQISKTLEILMGLDGTGEGKKRINQLAENIKYFREMLHKMGFVVYGHAASPVVPMLLFTPTKITHFSRFMLEKNIAVVSISFPVTSFAGGRVRFCVSAAHTREMLDRVLEACDECAYWNCAKVSPFYSPRSFKQAKEALTSETDNENSHK